MRASLLLIIIFSFGSYLYAQDSTSAINKIISFPDKLFGALDKKSRDIENKLSKGTEKYLNKIARQEKKLKKKMLKKDSLLAEQIFGDIEEKYAAIKNAPAKVGKYSSVYSGHLDSLITALNFLNANQLTNNLTANPQLQKSLASYKELQDKLNATEQIKKLLDQRQKLLKDQFQKLGMVKELKQFRKQVYYYKAQVQEYKSMFEDPNKLEAKLMELLVKIPAFKDFFRQNSQLGSLFALPGGSGASTTSLQGLQTRASVQQALTQRFGSGANVTQALQQNVQAAQGQLNELKNKLNQYTNGSIGNSSTDVDMPDFKPNNQKTKSFLQRLEYGANIQTQKARHYFPVTSDIGLSLGYKINDKSTIGIGASYQAGLGRGWDNLQLSHQGIGIRSFIDFKIKGSLFITGGYEQNYKAQFQTIDQLQNYSAWQTSGLIGLSKKYKVSKKLKGNMQLLWDFMSYQQVPRTQAVLFRVGYSFK